MFFLLSWEVSPGNIQSCYNLSHQSDLLFFLSLIPTFEWYTKELSWFFCEWRNSSAKVYILAMIKCIVFKCLLHNVLCACCMIPYYKTSGCYCWKHPGVLLKNIPMFYCKTWGCSWVLPLEMKDGESRFFVERKYTVIVYKKVPWCISKSSSWYFNIPLSFSGTFIQK